MELRILQYFLAVTGAQSISGAAKSLHITQSTLSRQLMEPEKEPGSFYPAYSTLKIQNGKPSGFPFCYVITLFDSRVSSSSLHA